MIMLKLLRKERTIVLSGTHVMNGLDALKIENFLEHMPVRNVGKDPLYVVVNLPNGGDFYATQKIRKAFAECGMKVISIAFGLARSTGLTLLQCGAERWITQESALQFHHANKNFPKDTTLNARALQRIQEELIRIDGEQIAMYSARADYRTIRKLFDDEAFLSARQAKAAHLVDRIIPEPRSLDDLIQILPIFLNGK